MSRARRYRSVLVWLLCSALLQFARAAATGLPQAVDHPLIRNSIINALMSRSFSASALPLSFGVDCDYASFTRLGGAMKNPRPIGAFTHSFCMSGPPARSEVIRFRLYSAYLDQEVPILVYLPAGYGNGGTYPVWYGLHGYSSTENMWLMDVKIGDKADGMMKRGEIRPLIMVFPQVRYDSFKEIQADMKDGVRGESFSARFICEELVPYADAHFQTAQATEDRFIGGFSMGGLLALEIGLRHPELFGKVGAYSPALPYSNFSGGMLTNWLYPTQAATGADDLAGFASAHSLEQTRIYLDSGDGSDPFSQSIRSLNDSLQTCGVSVAFHTHGGGHTLKRELLRQYLLFYAGNP